MSFEKIETFQTLIPKIHIAWSIKLIYSILLNFGKFIINTEFQFKLLLDALTKNENNVIIDIMEKIYTKLSYTVTSNI